MHWKTKALIQNMVAKLPQRLSYKCYYWIQRKYGGLKAVNPMPYVTAALKLVQYAGNAGMSLDGCHMLEVGTGRRLNMPLVYWLAGAARVTTVDLNPYLTEDLIQEDLEYLSKNWDTFCGQVEPHCRSERITALREFLETGGTMDELMEHCQIHYWAPADATDLDLEDESVDLHVSYNVLEHIPTATLSQMFQEAVRIMKANSLFIHKVDFSDHFSHSDPTITPINFLQFDQLEWDRIAGNRYMFMNRLRVDDYPPMMTQCGLKIDTIDPLVEEQYAELVSKGELKLADEFAHKNMDALVTREAWFIATKS